MCHFVVVCASYRVTVVSSSLTSVSGVVTADCRELRVMIVPVVYKVPGSSVSSSASVWSVNWSCPCVLLAFDDAFMV